MKTKSTPHESARLHVTGEAVYIDDIHLNDRLLVGKVVYSKHPKARILSVDFERAEKLKGVYAIITHKDLPANNQMGCVFHDEPVLAMDEVLCIGQAILLIAAESDDIAEQAAALIEISYETQDAILTVEDAMKRGKLLQPQRKIERGDIERAFRDSDHIIEGSLEVGGQEHWYLETQTALCVPGEYDDMKVFSSTQNPTETQALVAEVLGIDRMCVEVETRRMGGAFGGKESQASHIAIWAALLARKTRRPVKIRLFRDDDQIMTGKRHPFLINYKAGFNKAGEITAVDFEQNCNGGYATDLTMSILERAQMHADNAYFIPNIRIIGNAWQTNLASNTAFRGFGGPQGMAAMETIIDRIARSLCRDSEEIRRVNFYGESDRNLTPYGQKVENNRIHVIWPELKKSAGYSERRKAVNKFNSDHLYVKRGLAITPVKFGISFTTSFLNQAGALVNIYRDGSVLANHGGTEMGQGLNTKIAQIAALELGIDLSKVKVTATNTSKVPNTSPTAASSGTDMNGMAVKNAIDKLKKRIAGRVAEKLTSEGHTVQPDELEFGNNRVYSGLDTKIGISFNEAVELTYFSRISLSATGFYKTPGVHFDRVSGTGNPFFYFAYGAAVSEVELDILTGYHKLIRTDILHDAGDSLNPEIDLGQVEGAYIQGVGWCTTEEMKYSKDGRLLNHSPDTYKIPAASDIPEEFNVSLLENAGNQGTIRKSKAVGEPPFMLAFSTWLAIKDAISAVANHTIEPDFKIPATNENILLSIQQLLKSEKK